MATTAKSTERALNEVEIAIERDIANPQHRGVHGHLVAARTQLVAVAKLLATAS